MTDMTVHQDNRDPDIDAHEAQALAMYKMWADKGRKLEAANDQIDELHRHIAGLEARNTELVRSNDQLNQRVSESMLREANAISEASRLKGIMHVSGNALADGMNRDRAPSVSNGADQITPFRLRPPPQ